MKPAAVKRKAAADGSPPETPTEPTYPAGWVKGQLLDLKRFTDGSYRATLLGEDYKPELANAINFASSFDAQNFVSWWYQPAQSGRGY